MKHFSSRSLGLCFTLDSQGAQAPDIYPQASALVLFEMSRSNEPLARLELTRDEDYYFQDAIFWVENRLFKVPARFLTEVSDVFRAMFELPQGDVGGRPEGTADDNPIHLEGVKSDDFKQLLKVLFASRHVKLDALKLEHWTSVLQLSSKWDMKVIRELAITTISSMIKENPRTQLVWGQMYDVETWIFEGASALVNRLDAMNEEDVEILGLQATLKIAKIREELKGREIKEYQSISGYPSRKKVNEKMGVKAEERVRVEFKVPLIHA